MTERRLRWLAVGTLAVLAYLPALLAAPGRMPADSKLYPYLDPGRFLADAAGSFDPRQFAGWVPHQHIGYLWPSGPWFWLFDLLAVPDWVSHRLWLGTVFLIAGLGARACARRLGLGHVSAMTAAVAYQTTVFVLPYVSRTSVLLLPWAGLGWIVALTIRAVRRGGWAHPAAIALVVLTVGSVNATALAMIAPAPVLFLVHEAWRGASTWRRVVGVAGRTALLSLAVSLWWITMLAIQGRHGTDVLPYSESLRDVSVTATSPEVWRGLGYWLFYVRDPFAATTTESLRYLSSTPAIAISFAVPVAALAGLVWVRWEHRRFAALLVSVGFFLAVGVHPIDDRAPLVALLTGSGEGGAALALRSSTRAIPMLALGLALALGSLVAAIAQLRPLERFGRSRVRLVGGAAAMAMCVGNLPALWTGALVDPAIDRDSDPPASWRNAAAWVDDNVARGRVLQLPGAEFGAYRWGYTVDQPLPGLVDVPVVTRDLLPLGSPAAMDLLLAFDDRAQDGVLEPAAIADIARLLGAEAIWLTNDHEHERFRTARPEIVRDLVVGADGVGAPIGFGTPGTNDPDVPNTDERAVGDPRVGEPVLPVELVEIVDAPGIIRAAPRSIAVSGSGEGLVDAAAAGLLPDDAAVHYSASYDDPTGLIAESDALIVTDSNRAQARHWRSSQDTRGFTEHADRTQFRSLPDLDPLRAATGDERLPLFAERPDRSLDHATTAYQDGAVSIAATSYGEPFAYLPEHRPAMAVDGDPETAWLVGEHGDPIGERLVLTGGIEQLLLRQPDPNGDRRIARIGVTARDSDWRAVDLGQIDLDDRSVSGEGQPIEFDGPMLQVTITIEAVGGGTPFTGSAAAGVGFSEIAATIGLGAPEPEADPTVEWIRPPHDALRRVAADTPLAIVLTRWRTDPMDRWRDDPEPALRRVVELVGERTFDPEVTVRIDARADDAVLAELFDWPVVATSRLTGSIRSGGVAAFDGDPASAWITAFDEALGARLLVDRAPEPVSVVTIRQPVSGFSRATWITVRSDGDERTAELVPDAMGTAVATLDPPLPAGRLEIEISGVDAVRTIDRRFGDPVDLPVAIWSIDFEGAPRLAPLSQIETSFDCVRLADIDGEPVTATIRVAGDGWLDGEPLDTERCSGPVTLESGRHEIDGSTAATPFQLDRLVLDSGARAALAVAPVTRPTVEVVERSRFARTVEVTSCSDGCWLVLGEGFNDAWSAQVGGVDLGPPQLVDGGFNGWWLDGVDDGFRIELRWTAQRPLTIALLASLLATLAALAVVARAWWIDRRSESPPELDLRTTPRWVWAGEPEIGTVEASRRGTTVIVWTAAAGLLIAPIWAIVGAVTGIVAVVARRRRLAELIAVATVTVVGTAVTVLERRDAPVPNGAWPTTFESLHRIGVFAAVAVVVAAASADDAHSDDASVGTPAALPDPDDDDHYARPS